MKTQKTMKRLALALSAAAFLNTIPNARALDNWQTVNDFPGVPGNVGNGVLPDGAGSTALQTDTSRTLLFDGGSADLDGSGIRAAVCRVSADGITWSILDAFLYPQAQWTCYRALATDVDGGLYGGGFSTFSTQDRDWLIREWHTGDAGWSTTDELSADPPATSANCADIKVAPWGDVFASGVQGTNWTVRRRQSGSSFYTTVDSFPSSVSLDTPQAAYALGFHSTASVLAVGYSSINGSRWLVRRSVDRGDNWTTVDSFIQDRNWRTSFARSIAVDRLGKIYVAGEAYYLKGNKGTDYWLVRRSVDGGKTWATVDQFSYGTAHHPYSTTTDDSGNILVAGYVQTPNGEHWIVRKGIPSPSGSITWTVSDDYQLVQAQPSQARGIVVDSAGNVFASGRGLDAAGVEHWLTRKLAR